MGDQKAQLSERDQALNIYEQITKEFATDLEQNDSIAYANKRKAISDNARLLVAGGIYSAPDIHKELEDISEHVKHGTRATRTMGDIFHDWLNGKQVEV
jgi:hypothetical protein